MGEWMINDRLFSTGVVHLESYTQDAPYRKKQLAVSFQQQDHALDGIVMGTIPL
jgi:hypothetical protein